MFRSEDARKRSHCGITSNMSDTPLRACVDEGHGCGKETIVAELLAFLSVKNGMKHVRKIWKGSCEALENYESARRTEIDAPRNENYPQSVLEWDSSVDPISLLAEYTVSLLILVEVEGQQELLEIDEE